MTPTAAINHILDGVDGIEIDADNDGAVTALLKAGVAIIGIALQRLEPHEREALLRSVEHRVRWYIAKVEALQARRQKANGHAARVAGLPRVSNGYSA